MGTLAEKIWKGRLPPEKKIVWDGGASSKIAGLGISISQNTLFDQFSEEKKYKFKYPE